MFMSSDILLEEARPIAANVINLIVFTLGADSGGVGCHFRLPLFAKGEHGE